MSTRGDDGRVDGEPSTRSSVGGASGGVTHRPGGASEPAGGTERTGGTELSGGTERPAQQRGRPGRNTVGWVALLVAALLTAWQVVVALTIDGVAPASQEVYAAVALFVTLILAVGAVVLGLVALSQRREPRWPALVGLAVGAYAFLVTVASWIGGLMNTGV